VETSGKKGDPIAAGLVERHGMTRDSAETATRAVFEVLRQELLSGNSVAIPDFATLKDTEKKAQIVKDPATGHQLVTPAENVVAIAPLGSFQRAITQAKLSSIILAVPHHDTFAKVIEFHFSRVGWRVYIVDAPEKATARLAEDGTHLLIVDHALPGAARLVEEVRTARRSTHVPVITLHPASADPAMSRAFQVLADERLVEPFEVYNLLMIAESELARASEEEVIFDHQVSFQLGTRPENVERAMELLVRLLAESGMISDGQELFHAACREALGNAAQHGNRDDPEKLIRVQYLLDKEKATLAVTDDGPGFDHERYALRAQTKDPASAAIERHEQGRAGGLGIMLMLKCADRVEYNSAGNTLTISRGLRTPAVPESLPATAPVAIFRASLGNSTDT
jgi:anti-sigma regulatory factor (Ser/Thr protein kinase)/nucleoid DNA-binding protein/CheY-like chemotaxis protein